MPTSLLIGHISFCWECVHFVSNAKSVLYLLYRIMMASSQNNHDRSKFPKSNLPEQKDMEITCDLLDCFGFSIFDGVKIVEGPALKRNFIELAEDAMKDMENPFAKDLLRVAIKEWKLKKSS